MIETYQKIVERMKAAGLGIKKHYLDNNEIHKSNITYEGIYIHLYDVLF